MSYQPLISDTPLDIRRIRAALAGRALGCEVQAHEEIASTSDLARELGGAGHPHGTVVFAEFQSAGRGRRENRWSSAPRKSLLFSVLLRPAVGAEKYARLATLAALGLCRGVENSCGLNPMIKWPNDLLLRGRKFCGILAEMFTAPSGPFMVLGAGMNVNTASFPDELRDTATSLRLESAGKEQDRTVIAISLLRELESSLASWDNGFEHIVAKVKRRSSLLGQRIRAQRDARIIEGVAHDLDAEGRLIVRGDDGALLEIASAENVRLA